jgi:hypothetical protein
MSTHTWASVSVGLLHFAAVVVCPPERLPCLLRGGLHTDVVASLPLQIPRTSGNSSPLCLKHGCCDFTEARQQQKALQGSFTPDEGVSASMAD